ncbi:MAG: substrate-binding domain-containing protein [Dehalococcoidia bacterium]
MLRLLPLLVIALVSSFVAGPGCGSGEPELLLGVTTSVQDSGLLDVLVEGFEARYDYNVKPIVGGSGQILEQARRGEFDVLLTHSPVDEEALIAQGYGMDRTPVMQNFFLLAGPDDDPAGVGAAATVEGALRLIATSGEAFVSRGDGSGTHRREMQYWASAGIDPVARDWYTQSATGQGQNLLVASDGGAYTLTDSATFVALMERVQMAELFRDTDNPNVYSLVRLDSDRLDGVNAGVADAWLEFMTGTAQEIIAEFGRDEYGEALFEPIAR